MVPPSGPHRPAPEARGERQRNAADGPHPGDKARPEEAEHEELMTGHAEGRERVILAALDGGLPGECLEEDEETE